MSLTRTNHLSKARAVPSTLSWNRSIFANEDCERLQLNPNKTIYQRKHGDNRAISCDYTPRESTSDRYTWITNQRKEENEKSKIGHLVYMNQAADDRFNRVSEDEEVLSLNLSSHNDKEFWHCEYIQDNCNYDISPPQKWPGSNMIKESPWPSPAAFKIVDDFSSNKTYYHDNDNSNNIKGKDNNSWEISSFHKRTISCPFIRNSVIFRDNIASISIFLNEINLGKYHSVFIDNGIDNLSLLIEQEKQGKYLLDSELKNIGVSLPGERALILIHLRDKAQLFNYNLPNFIQDTTEPVRYTQKTSSMISSRLYYWWYSIKMEEYFHNFLVNAYYNLDLLFIQNETPNPWSRRVIQEEIGIKKIGHCIWIWNKLQWDREKYFRYCVYGSSTIIPNDGWGDEDVKDIPCKCLIV